MPVRSRILRRCCQYWENLDRLSLNWRPKHDEQRDLMRTPGDRLVSRLGQLLTRVLINTKLAAAYPAAHPRFQAITFAINVRVNQVCAGVVRCRSWTFLLFPWLSVTGLRLGLSMQNPFLEVIHEPEV